jgi:hypothetical protein
MGRTVIRSLLLFSPVVVAFFVMLPRLLSPQFGVLDDGMTLRAVAAVSLDWTNAFEVRLAWPPGIPPRASRPPSVSHQPPPWRRAGAGDTAVPWLSMIARRRAT